MLIAYMFFFFLTGSILCFLGIYLRRISQALMAAFYGWLAFNMGVALTNPFLAWSEIYWIYEITVCIISAIIGFAFLKAGTGFVGFVIAFTIAGAITIATEGVFAENVFWIPLLVAIGVTVVSVIFDKVLLIIYSVPTGAFVLTLLISMFLVKGYADLIIEGDFFAVFGSIEDIFYEAGITVSFFFLLFLVLGIITQILLLNGLKQKAAAKLQAAGTPQTAIAGEQMMPAAETTVSTAVDTAVETAVETVVENADKAPLSEGGFCASCGQPMSPEDIFCQNCGMKHE